MSDAKKEKNMITRREFLDTLALGGVGLAINSTAKSYGQILGSNDRLNFAVIGLHSRAYAHLSSLKANKDTARVAYVCDVDTNTMKKFAVDSERELGYAPRDPQETLQDTVLDLLSRMPEKQWPGTKGKLAALRRS